MIDKSSEFTRLSDIKKLQDRHGFVIVANFAIKPLEVCDHCFGGVEFYFKFNNAYFFIVNKGRAFGSGDFYRQMNGLAQNPHLIFRGIQVQFDILSAFIKENFK